MRGREPRGGGRRATIGVRRAFASAIMAAAGACLVGVAACSGRAGAPGPGAGGGEAAPSSTAPGPPVGLDVVRSLEFPPLRFDAPEPDRFVLSNGVTVFFLRDPALPLVDVFVDVRGGYAHFDRELYAAGAALLPLMRHGGAAGIPPDSVDELIAYHALALSTSTTGGRIRLGMGSLTDQLDVALGLWSDILLRPRFDSAAIARWRLRELEAVRRLPDLPGPLAVVEFNRLLFGDHPTGWRLRAADLAPDRLRPELLHGLHARVVCPENAVIGASGDIDRETLRGALETALDGWERCGAALGPAVPPKLTFLPRVYVIHRPVAQTTIVVGQPGGVRLEESPDYFASRVANWILGGSGFTSRLMGRLRTEEGLAYSAATVWGVARRHERILGGITHTAAENTIEATELMIDVFDRARTEPPTAAEINLARDAIVNGFVFGFTSPARIVSRQVAYLVQDLPADWLERYVDGVRAVDSTAVATVLRETIDTDRFTVLVVGDTTKFDARALGDVEYLEAEPVHRGARGRHGSQPSSR